MTHDCADPGERKVVSCLFQRGYFKKPTDVQKRRTGHTKKMNSSVVIHGNSAGLESSLGEKNGQGSGVNHEPAMCPCSNGG